MHCLSNISAADKKGAELPTPKHILYPREKVKIGWKSTEKKWVPGAGMMNVGNTCYLNSTLQALFHVPAFANWLISDYLHRETCEDKSKSISLHQIDIQIETIYNRSLVFLCSWTSGWMHYMCNGKNVNFIATDRRTGDQTASGIYKIKISL